MSVSEMIEITVEEYDRLQAAAELLSCLEAVGVDNWDGYEYALNMMEE